MSNRQNPLHLPMRRPTRLSTYDYSSPGAYYVTICTEGRIPYFNQPELRLCLLELWQALPGRFPRVTLDEFVIMHDHVHGILWLHGEDIKSPSLGDIIGAYKSLTTRAWLAYNKKLSITVSSPLWQRGFHDHILRNEQDLTQKRQYIRDNPLKQIERELGKEEAGENS